MGITFQPLAETKMLKNKDLVRLKFSYNVIIPLINVKKTTVAGILTFMSSTFNAQLRS